MSLPNEMNLTEEINSYDECCREPMTEQQEINSLREENAKLHEEIKLLHDKLTKSINFINHLKFTCDMVIDSCKNQIDDIHIL